MYRRLKIFSPQYVAILRQGSFSFMRLLNAQQHISIYDWGYYFAEARRLKVINIMK